MREEVDDKREDVSRARHSRAGQFKAEQSTWKAKQGAFTDCSTTFF